MAKPEPRGTRIKRIASTSGDAIINEAIAGPMYAVEDERNGGLRAMLSTDRALACVPLKDTIKTARPGPNGTFGLSNFTRDDVVAKILMFGAALTGPEAQAKGWGLWIIDAEGDLLIESALPGTIPAFFIGGAAATKGMEAQ